MATKPVFGYWDMRGHGEPVRYLFHYLEIPFMDKRYPYPFGPPPTMGVRYWLKDEYTVGLDFPNLPYLIDGDLKMSQSNAILRYLGRKYNVAGTTEQEKIRVEMCEQRAYDLRKKLLNLCSSTVDFDKNKQTYIRNLPYDLELFTNFLGDRKFVIGDKVTYADFMLYEAIEFNRLFEPESLTKFEALKQYLKRVEALPGVAKYMNSNEYPRNRVWYLKGKWHGPET